MAPTLTKRGIERKPIITTRNLSVNYDDFCAVRDVSLSVTRGEFVAVVGTSGCGKSTMLHALAGFLPFSGEVTIQGSVGMVAQQHSVFPWMTVRGNIAFGLESKPKSERDCIVAEYLELTGLLEKADRYPAELSGGQVQRVALAQTLALNPEVLLLDEPYGALDAHTRGKMQEWLLEVWDRHRKTVMLVTHDIEEALFLANRVLVMGQGTITEEFSVPFERPRSQTIKFKTEFNTLRGKVFEAL